MRLSWLQIAALFSSSSAFVLEGSRRKSFAVNHQKNYDVRVNTGCNAVCDNPTDAGLIKDASISASILRNAGLTNAKDETVKLGDIMGKGKSVVIFLRHMG